MAGRALHVDVDAIVGPDRMCSCKACLLDDIRTVPPAWVADTGFCTQIVAAWCQRATPCRTASRLELGEPPARQSHGHVELAEDLARLDEVLLPKEGNRGARPWWFFRRPLQARQEHGRFNSASAVDRERFRPVAELQSILSTSSVDLTPR
jgi:hypothetical protein